MGITHGQGERGGLVAKAVFISIMHEPYVTIVMCALGRVLEEAFGKKEKLLCSSLVGFG